MTDLSTNVSVIALNVNDTSTSIKETDIDKVIKNVPIIGSHQEIHFIYLSINIIR